MFTGSYSFFNKRKGLFYSSLAVLLALMVFLSSRLKLEENIIQLLPEDEQSKELSDFFQNTKFSDRIMLSIARKDSAATPDPEALILAADAIVAGIDSTLKPYIERVEATADDDKVRSLLGVIDQNLPLFLEESDYAIIDTLIQEGAIKRKVESNFAVLSGASGIALKKFIVNDPLGLNYIAYKKLQNFQVDDQIELYEGHFLTKDQKNLLFFIHPRYSSSATGKNVAFFKGLDSLISSSSISKEYSIQYFGAPAVAAANAQQIRRDSLLTTCITLILLVLIVAFFFRRIAAPLLMMFPVLIGALFALSCIYLIKGEISIIAVGAGSVILGIAVNYSLHYLTHYRYHPDAQMAIKELSFPMTIGSATTVGGFLLLQFVKAPVLRDLGLFAAFSLIGAALATLLILPHLVTSRTVASEKAISVAGFDRFLQKLPSNRYLLLAFLLLSPVFFYFASKVEFESDMYKVNYMSPQLQAAEQNFNKISSYYQKSMFVVAKGNTLDEALQVVEDISPEIQGLKDSEKIKSYSTVSDFLTSEEEQQHRIETWTNFWTEEKKQRVLALLRSEGKNYHFSEAAFTPIENTLYRSYENISEENVAVLREGLLNNFIEEKNGEVRVVGLIKTEAHNSGNVYQALKGNKDLLVFDRQYITDNLVKVVGEDFTFIAFFSSLLVLVALLLSYGRLELALITFIPMALTWVWILGLMGLFGIKFNIINVILSTLVFALGDDYCIFTMDEMQQTYAKKDKHHGSVRLSILLSAITTIIGLGILIFAKHPALRSIALVAIIGIACVWLVSQTLQPLLFNWLIANRAKKGLAPITLWMLIKTVFAYAYFTFGALLLSLIGLVLTKLLRSNAAKYCYHWILCKFTISLIYIMPNVKKNFVNGGGETFEKPAVIIANHQSFLDILMMVMLHPKVILVTNKWVWNSPIFGAVVRMADYYPAMEGAENSLEPLLKKIKEGYSVVIFPEGTRSVDGTIKRFHKGAFFMAEQLKLDILPVLLHGTGYCLEKGDFLLKNERISRKILPRIRYDDRSYGDTFGERTKLICRYFREEYASFSNELETVGHYRDQLVSNFIYKGPVLEWYMKVKIALEGNYTTFNKLVPQQGRVLDIGCGYGFMSYMLAFTSPQRTIHGTDYDEEKISVANTGYSKPENLSFSTGNALELSIEDYDTILLCDILHYLQPDEQLQLLNKCRAGLNAGGRIIVRDGMKEMQERHKKTELTEWFSTRFCKFNKTAEGGLAFLSLQMLKDFAGANGLSLEHTEDSKHTSNQIVVMKS